MLTLAILAGGKSQRMGQDKAIMPFRGEALVRRVLDRLAGLAAEVIVIAPVSQEYLSLGIRIVPDWLPGRGPLGGLYTALFAASHPAVAAVACDMPFVSADLLAHLRDLLFSDNMDVVVPSSERGLEPLHAIYRRETCLPAVREALDSGEQRLISWFPRVKVRILTPEETNPFDPHGLMFLNVNTPDELAQAEKLAGENIPLITHNGV
ncbi:MAG: molybdenum cofactor guanylyltransferase [Chloroflexi bacterium]|nr:molybdenum cofactor guanylyltransferase [Chloroflexota bacterium]MBE3117693.1 molybdenum cofactor guanylyltransferase [Candidatus Atribacteria bacterium]